MAFEDIAGIRTIWSDYVGGTISAASGNQLPGIRSVLIDRQFTIVGVGVGAGTTLPAGSTMKLRVWVNNARKGLATVTLTAGPGAYGSFASGLVFTGPAHGVIGLSVSDVGAVTAGVGARYAVRYVHGWKL